MTSSETTFNKECPRTSVLRDEELIESLRLWNREDAADRIEQLAVTNEALASERDGLQEVVDKQSALLADAYGADLDWEEVLKQQADHEALKRIEVLEGKLAMAMHVIKGRIHWEASGLTCDCGECQALVATVAQIEGESHE